MKSFKIFSIGLLATAIISCSKNLDIMPTDIIPEEETFSNVQELEQGALAVYTTLSTGNTMAINSVLSDELKLSNKNLGQWQFEYKYQFTSSTESFAFGGFYTTINRANRLLRLLPGVPASSAAEEVLKDKIKGEMIALRAYSHFELLQRFAPAYNPTALGITNVEGIVVTEKLSRNTIAENLIFIEADLLAAKATQLSTAPELISQYGNIRVSKAFIAGIQARVALYKKDWTSAATFATEAINGSNLPLATMSQYPEIWTDGTSSVMINEVEVLFRLRRTAANEFFSSTNNSIVSFEPSDKLKNQFDRVNDIRFNTFFLISPFSPDTALVNKFYESARGPRITDVKVMRTSELYLIRAEAKAQNNDLAGAADDINAIRSRRINGYTNITYTDKAFAVSDIITERQKELCYEGFRLFDLKRYELGLNRLPSDVQSANWQNITSTDYRFKTLPIPVSELQVNPDYGQNKGY